MREALERYAKKSGSAIQVTELTDGEDIAEEYDARFDIIFLDIEMQFMDGMSAAEKIRQLDMQVPIVFVTYNPQYAVRGYRVGAADYLLKPVEDSALADCMERVHRTMQRRETQYITITEHGVTRKLDVSRIGYIEVQDHDLCFHTLDGNFETKGTISDVESQLSDGSFCRCNRCYLVNLEHVSGIRGSEVIVGNDSVKISRTRKKEFMDALNAYMS